MESGLFIPEGTMKDADRAEVAVCDCDCHQGAKPVSCLKDPPCCPMAGTPHGDPEALPDD